MDSVTTAMSTSQTAPMESNNTSAYTSSCRADGPSRRVEKAVSQGEETKENGSSRHPDIDDSLPRDWQNWFDAEESDKSNRVDDAPLGSTRQSLRSRVGSALGRIGSKRFPFMHSRNSNPSTFLTIHDEIPLLGNRCQDTDLRSHPTSPTTQSATGNTQSSRNGELPTPSTREMFLAALSSFSPYSAVGIIG